MKFEVNVFKLKEDDAKNSLLVYEKMTGTTRDKSFEFLNAFKPFIDPCPTPDRIKGFLEGIAMVCSILTTNCKVPEIYYSMVLTPEIFFAKGGEQAMAALALRIKESPSGDTDTELGLMLKTLEEEIKRSKPEDRPEGDI